MKNILKKALITTAAAAGLALLGSGGSAFAAGLPGLPDLGSVTQTATAPASQVADTPAPGIETAPSLNTNAQRFAEAGGHIGYGAAEGVAAAYIGAPQAAIDGAKYILTPGAIQLVPNNVPQMPLH